MATAPVPGAGKRAEAVASAKVLLTITVRGHDPVTIAPGNVPIMERLLVRKATGLPYDTFFDGSGEVSSIGSDSVQILWWLGRRAAGEPLLTFAHAMSDWEALGELADDDVDVMFDDGTGGGSDPEV